MTTCQTFGDPFLKLGHLELICPGSWATKAESLLHTFPAFFGSELPDLDNIDNHGIGVLSFGRGREGLVGLVSRFGVSFGDFVGLLPLGLKGDSFLIPIVNGRRDCIHRHDSAHEGRGNACGEVPNKEVLISDACEGGVIFEIRDIFDEGQRVGVVFPFSHAFSGEPGNGIAGGAMVLERGFELRDKVGEGPHSYGGPRDGVLSESGCPHQG